MAKLISHKKKAKENREKGKEKEKIITRILIDSQAIILLYQDNSESVLPRECHVDVSRAIGYAAHLPDNVQVELPLRDGSRNEFEAYREV